LIAQSEKLQKDFEAIEKNIQLFENKVRTKQRAAKKTNFGNDDVKVRTNILVNRNRETNLQLND
jgi:hypothetical protein